MKSLACLALAANTLALSINIPFLGEILPDLSLKLPGLNKLGEEFSFGEVELTKKTLGDAWKDLLEDYDISELNSKIMDFGKSQVPKALKQSLRLFDSSKFEFITNAKFPNHQMRVNKANPASLGIDTVKQTSGYLDFEDKHLFYYFFESRNDPVNDPVILWLNGGPGCSSMTGLFFELGPSSLGPELKPIHNPYSWNNNASVIFLEQPVGVGYSYGDTKIGSTYAAAKDVFVFLELFFQKFPSFSQNKFHIAGESYAGHYIPNIASEIVNHADRSFELDSVLIGNGITDSLIQDAYYQPMACGLGGYKQVLTDEACDQMIKDYSKCKRLVKACYATKSAFACVPASVYCGDKLVGVYQKTGLNPYDIRAPCETDNGLCYEGMDYIDSYMNQKEVQEALGAEVDSYEGCSNDVYASFTLTGDESKPFQGYVAELLEKNVAVLLYAGDKDFICNWLGNHAWSNALDWKHKEEFSNQFLQPWYAGANHTAAGEVKSFANFTFLRIFDAGHMVPYNQPEVSLNMLNTWVSGDHSFSAYL